MCDHVITNSCMEKFLVFSIVILQSLFCFSQELEFCTSLTSSTEQRFQDANGFGIKYQQAISQKFKVGLGIQYIYNNALFEEKPNLDWDTTLNTVNKINSFPKGGIVPFEGIMGFTEFQIGLKYDLNRHLNK